jgi:hypothetical protein
MQSSRAGDGGARGRRRDAKQRANIYQPLVMPLDAVTVEALDGEELQLQAGAEVAMLLGVIAVEVVVGKVMQGPAGVATALAAGESRRRCRGVAAVESGKRKTLGFGFWVCSWFVRCVCVSLQLVCVP